MRFLLAVFLCGCSTGIDCLKTACPNDPPVDPGTRTRCDKRLSSCGRVCDVYLACMDSNKSKTCGADGKQDPALLDAQKKACNASDLCTQCLLSIQ